MIQLTPTQAGLALMAANQGLTFTRFLTGSGRDENESSVQTPQQEVLIAHSACYLAGQTYTINGVEQTVDNNSIKLVGVLQTAQAENAYTWTELALLALNSNGEEVTIAYGTAAQAVYSVDPSVSDSYVINFELVFSDAPQVTVNTTQTGVTWTDFLQHKNGNITGGVHGLRYENDQLYINDVPMSYLKAQELLTVSGIDSILSEFPEPNLAWLGKTVLNRTNQTLKRLTKTEDLTVGRFVYQLGNVWLLGSGTETGSLLVVADDVTPSEGEITLSEAQVHFLEWQTVDSLSERLQALEDATLQNGALSFGSLDPNEYNSEWVSRMTGSGTEASPYLIYTPYDFNQIRAHADAVFRLMNNLDLTAAIGLAFSVEGGILTRGEADASAPLYNSGSGFAPIPSFSGVLDGNGRTVKGLTSCGDNVQGLINVLNGGKIQSLTLKGGYIVNTKNTAAAVYLGSFVGQSAGTAYILNGINHNTVLTTATNSNTRVHLGGILGYADCEGSGYNLIMRNCANHGRLYNDNLNSGGSLCGLIGDENLNNTSSQLIVNSSYNTADLTGVNVAGITRRFASINNSNNKYYITGCYNAGVLTGSAACDSLIPAAIASIAAAFNNCYGRSGYGSLNGADGLTLEAMKYADFVDLLNGNSEELLYAADDITANNGLPMLNFERNNAAGIPDLPLALLNSFGGKVYSSKFSYNTLRNLASKQDLRKVKAAIPVVKSITLDAADWTESSGTYTQSLTCAEAAANSSVLLIPQSADAFSYSLTVRCLNSGTLTFTASGQPTTDINIGVLVA